MARQRTRRQPPAVARVLTAWADLYHSLRRLEEMAGRLHRLASKAPPAGRVHPTTDFTFAELARHGEGIAWQADVLAKMLEYDAPIPVLALLGRLDPADGDEGHPPGLADMRERRRAEAFEELGGGKRARA